MQAFSVAGSGVNGIDDNVYVSKGNECYILGVYRRSSAGGEGKNLKGRRLRELREEQGIAQAELARRLQLHGWDVDIMVLNRVELGKRTLTDVEIQAILTTLGRRWADLDE